MKGKLFLRVGLLLFAAILLGSAVTYAIAQPQLARDRGESAGIIAPFVAAADRALSRCGGRLGRSARHR